ILATKSKRVELAPPEIVRDLPRLRARMTEWSEAGGASTLPFTLIGRRDLRSNNSWMHNSLRLVKGRERCTLYMHPEDAAARNLGAGQPVSVRSRVGAIEVPLEITDAVMRGVVSLPHGWGHGRGGVRLEVASRHAGASMNDITDDSLIDTSCGT